MAHISGYNNIIFLLPNIKDIYEVYAIARYDRYVEFIKTQINHLFIQSLIIIYLVNCNYCILCRFFVITQEC